MSNFKRNSWKNSKRVQFSNEKVVKEYHEIHTVLHMKKKETSETAIDEYEVTLERENRTPLTLTHWEQPSCTPVFEVGDRVYVRYCYTDWLYAWPGLDYEAKDYDAIRETALPFMIQQLKKV